MSKKKILVVDDEWSMLELMRHTLELSDFDPVLAKNGTECKEMAFSENPDMIIMDIMLGDEDGTEVYEGLLKDGFDKDVPVLFLSALAQDLKPTFPKPGRRYALVGKPFDPEKLIREMKNVLAGR